MPTAIAQNPAQNPSAVETSLEGSIALRFAIKLREQLRIMQDALNTYDENDSTFGKFTTSGKDAFNQAQAKMRIYLYDASDCLVFDNLNHKLHFTSYNEAGVEKESEFLSSNYYFGDVTTNENVSTVRVANINNDMGKLNAFIRA